MRRAVGGVALFALAAALNAQQPGGDRVFPIDLPTALQLGNSRAIDIEVATQRTRAAQSANRAADLLWVPSLTLGVDYFRHDGRIQDVQGQISDVSRGSFMAGLGPNAIIPVADALLAPLAARQVVRSRQFEEQSAANDTMLAVAEAYFTVLQARGELAGAEELAVRADELYQRVEALGVGLTPPLEAVRARAERARRRQAAAAARERWQVASAELARVIRLESGVLVEPSEPPGLQITLVHPAWAPDELIPIALTNRPELAARQALVQATLQRLRQEKLRPLIPSVLIRSASTVPSASLGFGAFGGGANGRVGDFGARSDIDVQLLWEFQNLGFGNKARRDERRAEQQIAVLELFRQQDRIAAEVTTAWSQVQSALARLPEADSELRDATASLAGNLEGLRQTRRIGETIVLIVRPAEAVAAVQALGQAYLDYYAAVADYNRAQFRLYRALGHPAQCVLDGSVPSAANDR